MCGKHVYIIIFIRFSLQFTRKITDKKLESLHRKRRGWLKCSVNQFTFIYQYYFICLINLQNKRENLQEKILVINPADTGFLEGKIKYLLIIHSKVNCEVLIR